MCNNLESVNHYLCLTFIIRKATKRLCWSLAFYDWNAAFVSILQAPSTLQSNESLNTPSSGSASNIYRYIASTKAGKIARHKIGLQFGRTQFLSVNVCTFKKNWRLHAYHAIKCKTGFVMSLSGELKCEQTKTIRTPANRQKSWGCLHEVCRRRVRGPSIKVHHIWMSQNHCVIKCNIHVSISLELTITTFIKFFFFVLKIFFFFLDIVFFCLKNMR